MTIYDFLKKPIKSVSVIGQALTNACDMNCFHCYSRLYKNAKVGIKECGLILRAFPKLEKINFGTGETYLNRDFIDIFKFYHKKNIRLALTTNGGTLVKMSDKEIKMFLSEVDISMDFPRPELHDRWRIKGSFERAISQIERLKKLGVETSIALALTKKNFSYLPEFTRVVDRYKIILRLNIYKPVHEKSLTLSYDNFWKAINLIADNFLIIGVSEPILSLIAGNKIRSSSCGDSLRVHADLSTSGCVYLSNSTIETRKFIEFKKIIPDFCRKCLVKDICRGGCLGRRILQADAGKPDPYCPTANNKRVPKIKFKFGPAADLMHLNYLCTILLSR